MKTNNVVKQKSMDFAVRIVKLVKYLVKNMTYVEQPICTQTIKCGTSIGANIREAEHAESREDFIHKMKIALKEANEADFWLELLYKTEYINQQQYESLDKDCKELNKLLTAIVNTTKGNN